MIRMDCGEVRELLQAYEDGELPADERAAIAGHLEGCPDCRSASAELQKLRRRLRAAGTFAVPPSLEARVRAALGAESQVRETIGWKHMATMAASHLATAVIGAGLAYALISKAEVGPATTRDVVTAHVRSLLGDQLLQVASADTHTVRPWFAGKVPFAPGVADLSKQDFPMLGGRLDYLLDRPVAAVVYGRRKHRINVFILPADQVPAMAGDINGARNGYNVVGWRQAGFAYFAVSDLNPAELQELATALRAQTAQ